MSRRAPLFLVFLLAYFLSYFFRSTNAVIANDLTRDLGLTAGQLGFMTSLFFVTFAAVQLPLGAALDRFGARRVTSLLMLAGVVGSALFALASTFWLLALGRALLGLGMAGVLMGSLKAFSRSFAPERFALLSSLFVGLGSLGAFAAATPLAWLNAAVGWRAIFWGGAAVIALSALLIALFGSGPNTVADDAPPTERGAFAAVFSSVPFWRMALVNLALAGTLFGYQGLWAGPYLGDMHGLSDIATGNVLLWMALGVTAGYLLMGGLANRFGTVPILTLGVGSAAAMQVALAFTPAGRPEIALAALFALFGLLVSSNVLAFAHARASFPLAMTGVAVTAVNIFGIGGSALVQWGLGALIGGFPQDAAGAHVPAAYRIAFLVTAGLCVLAMVAYLPLLRRRGSAA
jgi:MFS family permease